MTSSVVVRENCPPATRRLCSSSSSSAAVEKVHGGVTVWGITVGSNCQIALPVFGTLFLAVGAVLTVISYGWVGSNDDDQKRKPYSTSGNGRLLGPICLVMSAVMFTATAVLRVISTKARLRQTRVGFHCPVHGDFFPLSPALDPRKFSFSAGATTPGRRHPRVCDCFKRPKKKDSQETLTAEGHLSPQCPHRVSSVRHPSPASSCPTPKPFLIFTDSEHGGSRELFAGNTLFPDEPFGSIRSLSVPNDTLAVACFPVAHKDDGLPRLLCVPEEGWSHKRMSCPSLLSTGDEFPQPEPTKPLTPQVVKVVREIRFVTPIEKN